MDLPYDELFVGVAALSAFLYYMDPAEFTGAVFVGIAASTLVSTAVFTYFLEGGPTSHIAVALVVSLLMVPIVTAYLYPKTELASLSIIGGLVSFLAEFLYSEMKVNSSTNKPELISK